jgi:hypothetical protein
MHKGSGTKKFLMQIIKDATNQMTLTELHHKGNIDAILNQTMANDLAIMFQIKEVVADVTIFCPLGATCINRQLTSTEVCKQKESQKCNKYSEIIDKAESEFIPLAFTTYGERGLGTQKLFQQLSMQGHGLHCVYDARDTLYELTHGIAIHLVGSNYEAYKEWTRNSISAAANRRPATGPAASASQRRNEQRLRESAGVA